MIVILFIIISHSHLLICEDSRDINRTAIIIQDLNSNDQAVRQLVIYKASFYLENSIPYFLLKACTSVFSPTSCEILFMA